MDKSVKPLKYLGIGLIASSLIVAIYRFMHPFAHAFPLRAGYTWHAVNETCWILWGLGIVCLIVSWAIRRRRKWHTN